MIGLGRALRLTPSYAGENGLEIVEGTSGNAPVLQPFANGSDTDLNLYLFGLGVTGKVYVNGTIPASATHATTHEDGGSDPLDVTDLAGFPGGGTTFLRDDATWGVPTPGAHATSHQHGGSDEIATATAGANAIPKAGAGGKLAAGWVQEVLALADLTDVTAITGAGTVVVMSESPTINTPTLNAPAIADFTNAQHTHASAGQGGQLGTSALSNDAVTYAKIQNVSATDKVLGRASGGAGDVEEIDCTAAGRALLDDADAAAQRTTLGLGTLSTQSGTETDYVKIDGTRAMTGAFNAGGLALTNVLQISGINGSVVFDLLNTESSVNYLRAMSQAASGGPRLQTIGSDTDIDLILETKGAGVVKTRYSGSAVEVVNLSKAQSLTNKTFDSTSTIPAASITSGTIATARLGSGTADKTTVLRGDQTYAPVQMAVWFYAVASATATWTNMPAADTLFLGNARHITKADLTYFSQVRLCCNKIGTAAHAGATLHLRYHTVFSSTVSDFVIIGSSAVSVAVDASNTYLDSGWINLVSGAKADVFLALVGNGGNGAVNPQFGATVAYFR
jgi:hypothetical protein